MQTLIGFDCVVWPFGISVSLLLFSLFLCGVLLGRGPCVRSKRPRVYTPRQELCPDREPGATETARGGAVATGYTSHRHLHDASRSDPTAHPTHARRRTSRRERQRGICEGSSISADSASAMFRSWLRQARQALPLSSSGVGVGGSW